MSHLTIFLSSWFVDDQGLTDCLPPEKTLQKTPQVPKEGKGQRVALRGQAVLKPLSNDLELCLTEHHSGGQMPTSPGAAGPGITSFRCNMDEIKYFLAGARSLQSFPNVCLCGFSPLTDLLLCPKGEVKQPVGTFPSQ